MNSDKKNYVEGEREQSIAMLHYLQTDDKVYFYDEESFLKEFQECLDVYGGNMGAMVRADVLNQENYTLRYKKDQIFFDAFGEEAPPYDEWLFQVKVQDAQKAMEAAEQAAEKPLQVKVIIENGVVQAVLKDQNVPVHVEVVDCDDDYEDIEKLAEYRDSLLHDEKYLECDYNTAYFEEFSDELETPDEPRNPSLDDRLRDAESRKESGPEKDREEQEHVL